MWREAAERGREGERQEEREREIGLKRGEATHRTRVPSSSPSPRRGGWLSMADFLELRLKLGLFYVNTDN